MADATDVADKFMMMAERAFRQRDALAKALNKILGAEKEFRESMGEHWEGDPLSGACDEARTTLADLIGASK